MRAILVALTCLVIVSQVGLPSGQVDSPCLVTLRLVDGESQRPIPGLVRFRDEQGQAVRLDGLLARGQGLADDVPIQDWYVLTEPRALKLPRGRYTLTAFSGLETEYAERSLDLRNVSSIDVTLPIHRFHDAHGHNLWNANTHVHLQKITRGESDRYLVDVGMADGLDLVFVSYLERAEADVDYVTNRYTRGELHALGNDHVHFEHGEEHRHNFSGFEEGYGHVMMLAIPELVYPVSIGPGISKTGTDGLPLKRGIERARELGGTVIWCHNQWGLEDIPNWLAGRLQANNIFDGGTHGSFRHSFYRYLDCGIPVPFSTGTDWFIYDFSRVYVPHEGRPTPEQWLAQLEAGRSYITNGPLLEFSVAGGPPGSTLSIEGPRTVAIRGSARGRLDFERIELLRNGEVVSSAASRPEAGHFIADLAVDLDVSAPCWLALRTPPPSVPDDPDFSRRAPLNEYGKELFAHTSAVFVDVGGKRIFKPDVGRELLEEMEASREFIIGRGLFADDEERHTVLAVYDEGLKLLRGRLGDGASRKSP